jgi:outer membrane murein-binding lipoprotein Lpp
MKKVLLLSIIAGAFIFTGCANMGYSNSGSSKITDVSKAISVAEMKYKKVHEEGIAWQKTKAKIKKAKEFAKKGDSKNALAYANEAIYEADQAEIQAQEAEKTWRNAVPQ